MLYAQNLRCESLSDPIGIDRQWPRLSWIPRSGRRAVAQRAYHIQLREDDGSFEAPLWDSGAVVSDACHHIRYAGPELAAFADYRWRVRLQDDEGEWGEWSAEARFVTGFRDQQGWQGQWIQHPIAAMPRTPLFRRELIIDRPLRSAFLAVTARGIADCWIDGSAISDEWFTPGWTEYRHRFNYRVFDVTALLGRGDHVLSAAVAEGWFKGQVGEYSGGRYGTHGGLLCELRLRYADGSEDRIVSDEHWRCSVGPWLEASLQHGEHYDARMIPIGWDHPGFDADAWRSVECRGIDDCWSSYRNFCRSEHPPVFSAHPGQAVRNLGELSAIERYQAQAGSWIYDFGQNLAGVVRLRVQAAAGTVLRLRHGEMVNPDGTLYTENLRSARATDTYVCRGGGEEVFQPRFTFHGFRYLELSGLSDPPPLEGVTAVALGSDIPEAGDFDCDHALIRQLQSNIRWTQRSNFLEVPTDCPQRDERLGWTGDAQVFVRTAIGNSDVEAFFRKWLQDMRDEQGDDGSVPNVVPGMGLGHKADAAWGDAATVIPWTLYQCYGDREDLADNLALMRGWCDYCAQHVSDSGLRDQHRCIGDWLSLDSEGPWRDGGATPKPLIMTAYYAYSCRLTAEAAAVLGQSAVAEDYASRAQRSAAAFQRAYLGEDGRIGADTQTGYVLALAFDLLPEERRPLTLQRLVERIEAKGRALETGFVGTAYLVPTLARFGRMDLAYALLEREEYPGWLYSIRNGATTIWERWNGWVAGQGPGDANMNSYSHYAYGAVGEFLYRYVAGLDLEDVAFRRCRIAPQPGGSIRRARYGYESIHGRWSIAWDRAQGGYAYDIEVPVGCTADCVLPLGEAVSLQEDEAPLSEGPGVSGLRVVDHHLHCRLEAGRYRLSAAQISAV